MRSDRRYGLGLVVSIPLGLALWAMIFLLAGCTGYYAPNGARAAHRTQAERDSAHVADSLEFARADSIYRARIDTTSKGDTL